MVFLSLFFVALLLYCVFSISQSYNILYKGYAPFISTNRETIKKIIDEMHIKEDCTIYELGCGRATFLRMIKKAFPQNTFIGIENLFSVYFFTKIALTLQKSKIILLKKDFFSVDLKKADLVYCYLNPATMRRLGDKCKQECKPGTQIISRSFSIPQLEPEKVLFIQSKKVYFYKL